MEKGTLANVNGELTADDRDAGAERRFAKVYSLRLEKAMVYQIKLRNAGPKTFAPVLILRDFNGKVLSRGDNRGAGANAQLEFSPPQTATYWGRRSNFPRANLWGKSSHPYAVQLEAGKKYRFDLRSADFDAYLYLLGSDGKLLMEDDDGGGELNSRIDFEVTKSGVYHILACSLGAPGNGNYHLAVSELATKNK